MRLKRVANRLGHFVRHLYRADPHNGDALLPKRLDCRRERRRVASERHSENVDAAASLCAPLCSQLRQKLWEPSPAHALDLGPAIERAKRDRSGSHVLRISPPRQNKIFPCVHFCPSPFRLFDWRISSPFRLFDWRIFYHILSTLLKI